MSHEQKQVNKQTRVKISKGRLNPRAIVAKMERSHKDKVRNESMQGTFNNLTTKRGAHGLFNMYTHRLSIRTKAFFPRHF